MNEMAFSPTFVKTNWQSKPNLMKNMTMAYSKLWMLVFLWNGCLSNLAGQGWIRYYEPWGGCDVVEASNGDLVVLAIDYEAAIACYTPFIKRVDQEGREIWNRSLPMFNCVFYQTTKILRKSNGNFVIGATDFYGSQDTIRLLEINNDGAVVWERSYSSFNAAPFRWMGDFIETSDGGFLLCADVEGDDYSSLAIKLDSAGDVLWEQLVENIDFFQVIQLEDESFVLAGRNENIVNNEDIAVVGITSGGDFSWSSKFDSGNSDYAIDVVQTDGGQLAILAAWDGLPNGTPFFPSTYVPYLIKTTATGDSISGKTIELDYQPDFTVYLDKLFLREGGGFDILMPYSSSPGVVHTQIIQTDNNGERINEGNALNHSSFAMTPCANGGYAVVGGAGAPYKVYLAKADAHGRFASSVVQGNIFRDGNFSCVLDTGEMGLKNWLVKIEDVENQVTSYATTNETGDFNANLFDGNYEITALNPYPLWESCPNLNPQLVTLDSLVNSAILDFPMQPLYDCALMNVDVSAHFLRRCYDNTYYVEYCNQGTVPAENARVEVRLDEYMTVNDASLPFFNQGDSLLIFPVGDVGIGECGRIAIDAYLDCDNTVLGQTHCSQARVFPDSICFPADPNWDRSSIAVTGACELDSVRFFIQNEGTGDMDQPLNYYVVIDELIMLEGTFQLNSGEVQDIAVEAMGATYRLDAEQSPGHPGSSMPSATVEGCPDFASLGFVIWLAQNDLDHFIDIDCQQNVGAYDPNDKQAFPRGYGEERKIEPETEIEYKIRFQNTGTDTAFRVVVRDTLSESLDLSTFHLDGASHSCEWEILSRGVLKVAFENIMLPDSNVNEAASHGFFKYSIRPRQDISLGTRIDNRAAIYFDFNEPVLTNAVFHTIDTNFIERGIVDMLEEVPVRNNRIHIRPNPFHQSATFQLPQSFQQLELNIFDVAGRVLATVNGAGNTLLFEKGNLKAGIYFFQIRGDGKKLGIGKLVISSF
ncbi:MAG: T9SS type A sorting domain-containing protein [Phaeodactylibacter sp.]|nr:T9SS type A sorting domain-containing protein [Phaeodactylibacter sp.]